MSKLQFKTNSNCGNCVRSVRGFLDDVSTIDHWEVNTEHPDKILTVEGEDVEAADVVGAVEEAGYRIEPLRQQA